VAFVGIMFASFLIGYGCGQNQPTINDVEKVDTLFIYDTITQYEPIIEERVVLKKVLVPGADTLWKHDTMYVYLEREQVVWKDSLSRVYASGILPQIDSVQHFITERVVTRELTQVVKKPCKWGLGIHAGHGIQLGDQIRTAPYVGIGVSYNLLSW
jgi:hypothetical protein